MNTHYAVRSKVIRYPGMAAWYFAYVPKNQSDDIRERFKSRTRGWGSLRVAVTLGKTRWNTSIFPDKQSGTYLLPLKADVRKKEGLDHDDIVSFSIRILK